MRKYSRMLFLVFVILLSFLAGRFADRSFAYFVDFIPWQINFYFIVLALVIAIVCLVIGLIMILRLRGKHIDDVKTRTWLIIGSILSGLGAVWALRSVSLIRFLP